jgi:hypothetical protein
MNDEPVGTGRGLIKRLSLQWTTGSVRNNDDDDNNNNNIKLQDT